MTTIIPIHTIRGPISPCQQYMELIVKPTEACNFKCTFCSSTNITNEKLLTLDLDYIFKFLTRYPNTGTIIVNGGDPLMVAPNYYWELIDWLDAHNLNTTISLTTNLWAFFKKPHMWEELFKHPRVGVTTSFNYGDSRRVTKNIVYTEDLFQAVSDKFLDRIGYRPDFISVITDENEDTAIDNVRLAKKMDVECKLNYAMSSGRQGQPYQLSKMYALYVEVYNLDLWQWEYNTKQMMQRLVGKANSCPQNRTCDEGIRVLQPSGDYYSCGSFGDDRQFAIDFNAEMAGEFFTPLQRDPKLVALKDDCFSCTMFNICNGCRKTIGDMTRANMVEQHCGLMKLIAPKITEINNDNTTRHIDLLPKE